MQAIDDLCNKLFRDKTAPLLQRLNVGFYLGAKAKQAGNLRLERGVIVSMKYIIDQIEQMNHEVAVLEEERDRAAWLAEKLQMLVDSLRKSDGESKDET